MGNLSQDNQSGPEEPTRTLHHLDQRTIQETDKKKKRKKIQPTNIFQESTPVPTIIVNTDG